ncbi:MAG: hypothetical protein WAQ24_05025 [Candidatus Saccharimonadales bacterium]
MGLEFTNIPDRHGPAVYVFSDGTSQTEIRLKQYGQEIDALTPDETQVVYLNPMRDDGLRVKEFYGLTSFPCVLIVMDDDTIAQSWQGSLPQADQVSYTLGQIGGGIA